MPSVKFSEHSDRPEFIDLLKRGLGIKFKVYQEVIYIDTHGTKQQTDIVIFDAEKIDIVADTLKWTSEDSIVAIIETKIQREENLENHERQLFDYLTSLKSKIGFITNYHDISSYIFTYDITKPEKKHYSSENIEEIAGYIIDVISKNTQISITKTPEEIIRLLEISVNDLTKFTSKISGDEWEKILRLSDTLEIEEKKKELSEKELSEREKFFQTSAAYIAIAQILFYITFRQFRIDRHENENPTLRMLGSANGIPTQLQEIIEDIPNNDLNFKAIFGKHQEVFTYLDDETAPVLKDVVKHLEGLSARFVIENDLIGQIFQRLMPWETRKTLAAFYTLGKAAELLCRLAIKDKNETVYDPACGSGTLLVNAYKRKKELGLNQHKELLEQIRGSDISDIATMMSTINLAIQDPTKWVNHVNIFPYDAIDLAFGMTRFQQHEHVSPNGKMKVDPQTAYESFRPVDILLANPPFTRGSRLSERQREKLRGLPLVKEYGYKPNFKAVNLYAFFMLIAPHLIKKETGKIAFILPQGAINAQVMVDIWKILFKINFGLKIIIEASDVDESFSDSKDQEIMVILEKAFNSECRFVKLLGDLQVKNIRELVERIEKIQTPSEKTDDFIIQILSQKEVQSKTCMEWNLNPRKTLMLAYQQFIPLSLEHLPDNDKKRYKEDLSKILTIITENASRPVDYWFIPNGFWDIEKIENGNFILKATSKNIVITNDKNKKQIIEVPEDNFIPTISRSLKDYSDYSPIIPDNELKNFYLLDENRFDMKEYYEWGKEAHEKQLFGESHSRFTPALNSGGLVKKIDFSSSKTLALRFKKPMMGRRCISLGYYSQDDIISDLFFAYLSSSLFLLDAIEKSRKRRAEFVIIYQVDFYKLYRFPNLKKILKNRENTNEILKNSIQHNGTTSLKNRLTIPEQIREARVNLDSNLRKLDESWFKALNLPLTYLDTMYQEIEEGLKDIITKERS
jgi:hypothetical protein